MAQRPSSAAARPFGAPLPASIEVHAFHLHRFLAGWIAQRRIPRLFVSIGFPHSACQPFTVVVERQRAEHVEVEWTLNDLLHAHHSGANKLCIERKEPSAGQLDLDILPVLDRPATGGDARVLLGFILIDRPHGLDAEQLVALQLHVYEAICASRRNSVRLFFDEHRSAEIKSLIYAFMHQLPGWTGCDYAATLLLTSNLEAMTLEDSGPSIFNVLAERLFFPQDEAPERHVGLELNVDDHCGLLATVYKRQQLDPDLPYQLYSCDDPSAPQSTWSAIELPDSELPSLHRCPGRHNEAMIAFVPLTAPDGQDTDLLGFLAISYRERAELPSSVGQVFSELSDQLGSLLRFSSLYSLSARKLWLLRQMRSIAELVIAADGDPRTRVEALIGHFSDLIESYVAVPSFGIAYMLPERERGPHRAVRYVHSRGWDGFSSLDLLIDVPDDKLTETGVSSLAMRLNKPLVLAGRSQSSFKNSVHIHEPTRRVLDIRAHSSSPVLPEQGWTPLAHYYKPVRTTSYATLAYPITFCDKPIGLLSVEVDKDTNWLWWTGFGGQLFWQLVASELASAFHALGIRP